MLLLWGEKMENISEIDGKESIGVICSLCGYPIEWDNQQHRLIHECRSAGVV